MIRKDHRCGSKFPIKDGSPSQCDPSELYCCSSWGFCGITPEHCECPECIDYRKHKSNITKMWTRCGPSFQLPNGSPTQCDPFGELYCCSKWGFCGDTNEHCECPECVNYRRVNSTGMLYQN